MARLKSGILMRGWADSVVKTAAVAATGAGTVAADCPGSKMHREGGLEGIMSRDCVEHPASIVARRLQ